MKGHVGYCLSGPDVPENPIQTESAFPDILSLNDGLTADDGLKANGLTTIPLASGDGLTSDVAALDLLDPVPGPPRLANNAILALYRPSSNVVFSGVPGENFMPSDENIMLSGEDFMSMRFFIC